MSKIVVGVDGSEHAAIALRWAAARGEQRGDEVVAVFAWTYVDHGHQPPGEDLLGKFSDTDARQILDRAVAAAGIPVDVATLIVNEPAAEALIGAAGPDDLIVVGARGLGGFKGLLLGSVSQHVLEVASSPVAVIHGEDEASRRGSIVVGIDNSELSTQALHWAAAEAAATAASLRIVHAWQVPLYAEMAVPQVLTALEEGANELLAEAAKDPVLDGLTVELEVACNGSAIALLAHDGDASMIVVANRGFGPVKRLLLGSTSHQVVQHATVPVVVVS